jgi:hypothetical protein
MVTENQARSYGLGMAERATLNADIRWHQVVDELEKKIAELEAKLKEMS